MRQAKTKADDMILSAQKTAAQRSEEIISQAQKQAAQIKTKGPRPTSRWKRKKPSTRPRMKFPSWLWPSPERSWPRELNDADQDGMIDRFIEELGDQK